MTGDAFDLTALVHDQPAAGGVPHGALLTEFVDAVLQGGPQDAARMRQQVRATLGDAAFVDACATVASFNAVVKIADGSGIELEEVKAQNSQDLRAELGIDAFRHG